MVKSKKKSSLGVNVGIGVGITFAIVAVFLFVPLDDLIVTINPSQLEDIDIEIPDADKLGKDSILEGAQELFEDSTQNPLEILLDDLSGIGIGEGVTEKFLVAPKVILLDANQEQQLFETTLIIEPLDPRTTVVAAPILVEQETALRQFIDDDFSKQLTDDGKNYHHFGASSTL